MLKNIVYEDEQIIVAYKPAGIATQTAKVGQQDMVSELKNYLARKPGGSKKGEPYLGVVHRLDQPVSGLLVFAKTRQAAGELNKQLANGHLRKYYYALAYGRPDQEQGGLTDYLYKDGRMNCSLIVDEGHPGAKKAVLNYKLVKTLTAFEDNIGFGGVAEGNSLDFSEVSLLEIELFTGRHHQIRAQMAHAGMPLLGDGKYGSRESKELSQKAGCHSVALCAYKLVFDHPVTKKKTTFERQAEWEVFLTDFRNSYFVAVP